MRGWTSLAIVLSIFAQACAHKHHVVAAPPPPPPPAPAVTEPAPPARITAAGGGQTAIRPPRSLELRPPPPKAATPVAELQIHGIVVPPLAPSESGATPSAGYVVEAPTSLAQPGAVTLRIDPHARVAASTQEFNELVAKGYAPGKPIRMSQNMQAELTGNPGLQITPSDPPGKSLASGQPVEWHWTVASTQPTARPQLTLSIKSAQNGRLVEAASETVDLAARPLPLSAAQPSLSRPPPASAPRVEAPPTESAPPPPPEPGVGAAPPASPSTVQFSAPPAGMAWWMKALIAIAALFTIYGLWTAVAQLRARFAKHPAPAPISAPAPSPGAPVILLTPAGYLLQTQIFVIYHYEDEPEAKSFCRQLEQDGFRFAYQPAGFPAGSQRWKQHILESLDRSDAVLIVLTAAALGQEWVNWQIQKARDIQERTRELPIYGAGLDQKVFDVIHTVNLLDGMRWYRNADEGQTELRSLLRDTKSATVAGLACFISYSSKRRDFATRLHDDMIRAGLHTWMDVGDIAAGTDWEHAISGAIEKSTHVLFLLTPESVKSDRVADEIEWARTKHKIIIPVLEEPVELPFEMVRMQAVNFADYDSGFRKLLQALATQAAQAKSAAGAG